MNIYLSRSTTKPTIWPVRPATTQVSLGIRPVWSEFAVRSVGSLEPKVSSFGQQRLIWLSRCPGWSESSLGKHIILSCNGSYIHFLLRVKSFYNLVAFFFVFLELFIQEPFYVLWYKIGNQLMLKCTTRSVYSRIYKLKCMLSHSWFIKFTCSKKNRLFKL